MQNALKNPRYLRSVAPLLAVLAGGPFVNSPPAGAAESAALQIILYVSPAGSDAHSGESPIKALKTPAAAVTRATAGTIVRFDAGSYPPLKISGKTGTAGQPIIFEAMPGKEQQACFTSGKLQGGTGIEVISSAFVHLRGLCVTNSQKGINFDSVSHCSMQSNLVQNLGQEALHVGRLHTFDESKKFLGPSSEHVLISGNRVEGTGKVAAEYGEGIYIGTGAFRGDDTHDIQIEDNTLTDIGAEGMEIKPGTYNIIIRRNRISNTHHEYNGAITVAVEGSQSPNGNYLIEDNLIWQIKKVRYGVAGIVIGHGNAVIRNNLIWAVDGGIGIRVYATFANAEALKVTITNNTVLTGLGGPKIVLHSGTGGGAPSALKAIVQTQNNYTDDRSPGSLPAAAGLFFGPLTGNADAGRGPGSGFQLKTYRNIGADYRRMQKSVAN